MSIENPASALKQTLDDVVPDAPLAGRRLAVTVGSRSIPALPDLVRTLVTWLRGRGAEPFLVPAMGSHGGATAEGQAAILAGYGVTEASVGAPIISTMAVVQTASMADGTPLFCDRAAFEADGVVLFHKIKPHTGFKGPIESGLVKMAVIGLGNHDGAAAFHRPGFTDVAARLEEAGRIQLRQLRIAFAIGVLENAAGHLATVKAIAPTAILESERALLVEAKNLMGRLLPPKIDVLIVDRIGKDISGAGMDPNVTGRAATGFGGFSAPPIGKIVVLGLSAGTHGNASGLGLADFTTVRCIRDIDFRVTYANALAAGYVTGARLPMVLPCDRDAIAAAICTCFAAFPDSARVARIRDTKSLDIIQISETCIADLASDQVDIVAPPIPLHFDSDGQLMWH